MIQDKIEKRDDRFPVSGNEISPDLTDYKNLLQSIDDQLEDLTGYYGEEVTCFKGCSACCKVPRSVLPLEAEYLIENVQLDRGSIERILKNAGDSENCAFLVHDLCTIYQHRPIICRTHGLPLLYYFDDRKEYGITHCDLNFKNWQSDFLQTRVLEMETINEKLRQINSNSGNNSERVSLNDKTFIGKLSVI